MPTPLELSIEVIGRSNERHRWGPNEPVANRPRDLSFRTKLGEGFSDASLSLGRRIDRDYPDLGLVYPVTITGADGSVAYEGRIAAMPRELGDSHSIGVTLTGHMAAAADRKFTEIFVDRDLGAWGPMSLARRVARLAANLNVADPSQAADPTDSAASVVLEFEGPWASPYKPVSEAWYDAGPGVLISQIVYSWKKVNLNELDTNWSWSLFSSSDDKASASVNSPGELRAAGPTVNATFTLPTPTRCALLQLAYAATPASVAGQRHSLQWQKLAVYGNHGLPTYTGEPGEPPGVRASDVIRNLVARFCPGLNANGVQDTTYVIQHLAFRDRTTPYDAMLEVNKYHLWHLGVWENRTVHFRPYDLTRANWEIRTDQPGVTFNPQGPSSDTVFNGITVTYTDLVTGTRNVLTPDSFSTLSDQSLNNPWNVQGIQRWDEIELSTPTLQASALQIGLAALLERNRPKAPGSITLSDYVSDASGALQPGWKVRAGDTIMLTDFPNDSPRLIHETTWDDESKTLTLAIDAPAAALDAYLDRVSNALSARGLAQ